MCCGDPLNAPINSGRCMAGCGTGKMCQKKTLPNIRQAAEAQKLSTFSRTKVASPGSILSSMASRATRTTTENEPSTDGRTRARLGRLRSARITGFEATDSDLGDSCTLSCPVVTEEQLAVLDHAYGH